MSLAVAALVAAESLRRLAGASFRLAGAAQRTRAAGSFVILLQTRSVAETIIGSINEGQFVNDMLNSIRRGDQSAMLRLGEQDEFIRDMLNSIARGDQSRQLRLGDLSEFIRDMLNSIGRDVGRTSLGVNQPSSLGRNSPSNLGRN